MFVVDGYFCCTALLRLAAGLTLSALVGLSVWSGPACFQPFFLVSAARFLANRQLAAAATMCDVCQLVCLALRLLCEPVFVFRVLTKLRSVLGKGIMSWLLPAGVHCGSLLATALEVFAAAAARCLRGGLCTRLTGKGDSTG